MSDELEVNSVPAEDAPSMKEFEEQINKSLHKIEEGTLVKGTVIGISDTEVTVDLGYYAEGIIPLEELSNNPRFSIKGDVTIGEEVSGVIIKEDDGKGNILLSKKEADNILSWEALKEYQNNKTILKVKVAQTVNGGVTTYLLGIRAFIPASQLSLSYVEDLDSWVNKEIDVQVITVEEDKNKLVLSAKEVEKEHAAEEKLTKISHLPIGLVTKGIVEKLAPYGAFVNLGNGLSGLLHISQIANKRLKTPGEVLKEGQEVTVKIINVKDGKISLSIKAVEGNAEVSENVEAVPFEYSSGGEASTGLAGLLSKIKLS
ncbi:S1 RNA-binding domain-containing protein [Anaerocolumna xylanovorans]|uniref:Small subunit ribosomal protein S1 n=1 Tax=Anaerocolumna xylanovorans DSM 12503 TaxID=1121345 RepID=A0A1M7YMS3_9FIRM|nr:S1 RNA-binding domain-containing protein [Anaerocolumna xylanovorans]SHO53905.1 small subunit ribosomal protein S1 [Anaerocolumna xylanovorans DSM 12503]